jgi:hypothetical protein
MDPIQDGFGGVLAELVARGGRAKRSWRRPRAREQHLLFRSANRALAHSLFETELGPAPMRGAEGGRKRGRVTDERRRTGAPFGPLVG